jgi:predicted DsbA family dithiol-disulfide isomerase
MNDAIEVGVVCGIEGCNPAPTGRIGQDTTSIVAVPRHNLTIVSDVICPWCFVAKKNLEKALEIANPELQVEITWRPFELNPGMPEEGMNRREYRSKKFGSWENSQSLDAQVTAAAKLVGLTIRYDLMARTPNTFNAHRLIWLAQKEGAQGAVVESLFRAYFTEGRDVGDTSVLIDIAKEAGIAEERARAFLESAEGTDEVRHEMQTGMASGISSVPTFLFDGEALFSGALKPAMMADRLRAAAEAHAKR